MRPARTIRRAAAASFLAAALALASQLSCAGECVIEGDEIVVGGELSRRTFAGPPNYESVHKGDRAEVVWILTAPAPIALCPLASSNGTPQPVGRLNRFQLVLDEKQPALRQALIARYAIVRGRVLIGHAGHPHTAALIEVAELRPY